MAMPWWMLLALIPAGLLLLGLLYQAWGAARNRRRIPLPGRRLNGLHIQVRGSRGPWVVLEAGIAASSASWRPVAELIDGDFRVIAYDRAGFGWSDARPGARTLPALARDLHEVLDAAGVDEPVTLIGHSFGGLLARHFCAQHPERVRALVLADPLLPEEWNPAPAEQLYRLGRGVMLARRGATLARFGVVRLALDLLSGGRTRIPRLLARASSSSRGEALTSRLVGEVRKLPEDLWPVIRAHWSLPRSFRTLADYLELLPANCALPVDGSALRDKPLVVISAESADAHVREGHAALAALSCRGRHVVAAGSGHWVQLDRPDVIASSLREVTMVAYPPKE
jgi:pimeloyl-ACP methyl ester carboxylesterase